MGPSHWGLEETRCLFTLPARPEKGVSRDAEATLKRGPPGRRSSEEEERRASKHLPHCPEQFSGSCY